MNSLLNKYKWLKFLLGAFVVALGVTIIILACLNAGKVPEIINIVLACGFLLLGVFFITVNIATETHKTFTMSAIIGIGALTIGILMLITRFYLKTVLGTDFIVYLTCLSLLVAGAFSLIKGISLIIYKEKALLITIMFFLAIVSITLGILGLCYVSKLVSTSYILLGASLVAVGTISIIYSAIDKK